MPADSASDCSSTDRCRRQTTRSSRPRPRRRRQPPPPPRSRPKTRLSAALATRSGVRSTRAAVRLGRRHRQEGRGRRWVPEAAGRRRESAGPASQPPRAGQTAGGRLAGLRGTLRTSRPTRPFAPLNLLLCAHVHVVLYTVVLCMVLTNHIFDQAMSLESAKDHWSHRQSSQWTLERCARGHVPLRPRRGGRYVNANRVPGHFER